MGQVAVFMQPRGTESLPVRSRHRSGLGRCSTVVTEARGGQVIAFWFIRRFRARGTAQERRRLMELVVLPSPGVIVDIGEPGVPPLGVASVTLLAIPAASPCFAPTGAVVFLHLEPAERLAAAERHGWRPVPPAERAA